MRKSDVAHTVGCALIFLASVAVLVGRPMIMGPEGFTGPLWWIALTLAGTFLLGIIVTLGILAGTRFGPWHVGRSELAEVRRQRPRATVSAIYLHPRGRSLRIDATQLVKLSGQAALVASGDGIEIWGPKPLHSTAELHWNTIADIRVESFKVTSVRGRTWRADGVEIAVKSGSSIRFWPSSTDDAAGRSLEGAALRSFVAVLDRRGARP